MKIHICLTTVAISLLTLQAGALAGETLESVEKKIIEQWSKLKSMSAKTTMEMTMQGMSMKSDGTTEYLNDQGKEKYRMDMKMEQSFGDQKMEGSVSTISDGTFVYNLNDMMGQKMAMKQKADSLQGAPGGRQMFDNMKKNSELTLLPDEKIDGQAAYVIESKPKSPGPQPMSKSKMYFAKDSGIMIKMVGLDAEGKAIMTMNVKDVKLNPKISPDRFVFKAPEGVQVMDMTGS